MQKTKTIHNRNYATKSKGAAIPVFLTSDAKFAALTSVAMTSVAINASRPIDFYIIDAGIEYDDKKKIESLKEKFKNINIEFIKFDAEKEFKGFKTRDHLTIASYSRLMIPWLKPKIDRAVYIDGDVIAMRDIAELLDQDMEGHAVAASRCREIMGQPLEKIIYKGTNLSPKHKYFQAGILLINCAAWRADKNLPQGFWDFMTKYPNRYCLDQCILNKYFENNYKSLPQKFNMTTYHQGWTSADASEHSDSVKNIVLRHFIGRKNPGVTQEHFGDDKDSYLRWWDYASQSPFYYFFLESLMKSEVSGAQAQYAIKRERIIVRLFGFFPLLVIKKKRGRSTWRLFGFIPLLKIKHH